MFRLPLRLQTTDHPCRQPEAPGPNSSDSASPKFPLDTPSKYSVGSAASNERVRRANRGKIAEQNRIRPCSAPPRSRTFGRRTGTGPIPVRISPLRPMPVTHQAPTTALGPMILIGRKQRRHLRLHGMPHQLPGPRSQNLRQRVLNSLC